MYERHVLICAGTGCLSAGANEVAQTLTEQLQKHDLSERVRVLLSGCHGFCEKGPLVVVYPEDVFYCEVTAADVPELVEEYLIKGNLVERLLYHDPVTGDTATSHHDISFYNRQQRLVLRNCGVIDPLNIDEYIIRGGYAGLSRALSMDPGEVVEEVKRSGLRGRGGAGFATGLKWQFTAAAQGARKFVVCNADEGDPGAFMDRSILEGDPHAVLEGMMTCAYAVGASDGYVYVRAEYPIAITRLEHAIVQAREMGLLGRNVLNSGLDLDIRIKAGAGAFVCGEETALLASIEGHRGMPRVRPPFPAQKGLWGMPTNINNVETFANVPLIMREGSEAFGSVGTETSKGTKVFAITGKVRRTGLAEVPMGITLRDIVFDIAGGIQDDLEFKAVQIGGPSGGCLPAAELDLSVDYDSLASAGAMMGSGGLVVMDETTCMVDVAKFFLTFTQNESCGKCTPCREGTGQMLHILTRITEGQGQPDDIRKLEALSEVIKNSSLCGLGQTAPNPVLTTLRYFRHEYEAHIHDRTCPAGVCSSLVTYRVVEEKCKGCTLCARVCPVNAISGERREVHVIDESQCIACGECMAQCKLDAIIRVARGGER